MTHACAVYISRSVSPRSFSVHARVIRGVRIEVPTYGLLTSSIASSLPLSLPVSLPSLPSLPSLSASPSNVGNSSLRTVNPSFLYPSSSWSALPLLTATAPMDVAGSKMGRKYLRIVSRS